MTALAQIKNQVNAFSLAEQISLLEYLVQTIKLRTSLSVPAQAKPTRYFGCAKGELNYPTDIDFCNDEIAQMFGVDE